VSFIRIDHQTRLQVGAVEIVIESPFTVRVVCMPGTEGQLAVWT
jgi:hypothetical protein